MNDFRKMMESIRNEQEPAQQSPQHTQQHTQQPAPVSTYTPAYTPTYTPEPARDPHEPDPDMVRLLQRIRGDQQSIPKPKPAKPENTKPVAHVTPVAHVQKPVTHVVPVVSVAPVSTPVNTSTNTPVNLPDLPHEKTITRQEIKAFLRSLDPNKDQFFFNFAKSYPSLDAAAHDFLLAYRELDWIV